MSTHDPNPRYASMSTPRDDSFAGIVRDEAGRAVCAGRGDATLPPTEATPPMDRLRAVIAAATGRDRALQNTMISPPPVFLSRATYRLASPESIGPREFLRGSLELPLFLGQAQLHGCPEPLAEMLLGILVRVQGLG